MQPSVLTEEAPETVTAWLRPSGDVVILAQRPNKQSLPVLEGPEDLVVRVIDKIAPRLGAFRPYQPAMEVRGETDWYAALSTLRATVIETARALNLQGQGLILKRRNRT